MLIRPVFYKLFSMVLGERKDVSSLDGLLNLSARCLRAAECNMRIASELSDRNLLGKSTLFAIAKIEAMTQLTIP